MRRTGAGLGGLVPTLRYVVPAEWIEISQGADGRPSTLFARADGSDDGIEGVLCGGRAVVVARGEFRL